MLKLGLKPALLLAMLTAASGLAAAELPIFDAHVHYSHDAWGPVPPKDAIAILPAAPAPDLIFFDMFSSKTSGAQWTLSVFRQIFAACAGRPVELFTYSCSTPVRSALLAAGFHLARGCSTGDKVETTIALTPEASRQSTRYEMLGAEWLGRWQRSGAKFPADLPETEKPAFEQSILRHPQFQSAPSPLA